MANPEHWRSVAASANTPSYSVFTQPIEKSEQDDRDYQIIRLENGLEATLIHDSKADKAAASLDVAVGHLSDPDDMPGLAHFCEHLLFMGTEQYPKENEYSEFLAKNNGGSNAYTSVSNTNYYFSVATTALPGALARFAAFFHCPLFSPTCTSRELNAVDSEHKKNHQSDMWRLFQLSKHLSKPGHPWNKFGSGNRDSLSKAAKDLRDKGRLEVAADLKASHLSPPASGTASPAPSITSTSSEVEADGGAIGRETRRRLVEWWTKEYSAERMHLSILGKESLDELAVMAATLFTPIASRGYDPLPAVKEHPYGTNEKGTLVSAQTIASMYAMEISFPLEDQSHLWELKPAYVISHLVGHEGPGSLHSYLKNTGWITDLSAGPQSLGRGFDMFKTTCYLTIDGFKNYKSVVAATMSYFAMLRDSPLPEHVQEEQVLLDAITFRFKEKGRPDDYTSGIAARMTKPYPPQYLLSGPALTRSWKTSADPTAGEKKVREYLDAFRLQNGRVTLMAKEDAFATLDSEKGEWKPEPWYGTNYRVSRFDEDFIAETNKKNAITELFISGPNEFIPENLDVEKREVDEPAKRPKLIRETNLSTLWHKKDDRFFVPKAYVLADLRSPFANDSPRSAVINRLYSDLVTDSLTEFSYDASLAGLKYNFASSANGIFISASGYNDKLAVLLQHVLEKAKGLTVDPARFAVMKEEAKRGYENFFLAQSYQLADYYARYLLTKEVWTIDERLEALASVTVEDVQQFVSKIFSQTNTRMLVTGNVFKEQAIEMAEIVEQGLGPAPMSPKELNELSFALPEGINQTWSTPIRNPEQPNYGLVYLTTYGPTDDQSLRVKAALLTQILKEPAFNVLRTQEQLGYIVFCTGFMFPGEAQHALRLIVQSERSAAYCENRVEAFFDVMKKTIEDMTDEQFEEQKAGLDKKWREKVKNLREETSQFQHYVDSGHLDFLRNEEDAEFLTGVTKSDVYKLFMSRVHQSSKTRTKLSVHMLSQKERPKLVSPAAVEAFEALLRESEKFTVDDKIAQQARDTKELTLTSFATLWAGALGKSPESIELLKKIPALMKEHPAEGDVADDVVDVSTIKFIEDPVAFRAGLSVAPDPSPLAQWHDLPTSRI